MRRHRSQPSTPDLFSAEVVRGASLSQVSAATTTADRTSQRRVLPKDLSTAVKYLTDTELDQLITASVEEARRRGKLPPSIKPNPPDEPERSSSKNKRQPELTTVSLTRGQVNAVRASFKAGITPSRIARQFGISQSDVRKVLASNISRQKGG
jgi:hypothetical protein